MKIAVTGSEGFIGKNLVKHLLKSGHDVTGFDIKNHKDKPRAFYDFVDSIRFYHAVIHLGANSSTTETDFNKILHQNFLVSKMIFEECGKSNVLFQYASSASIYGHSKVFVEDGFYKPLNPYAMSKYMFDCYVLTQDYDYQGFRYFNVYSGEGEDHKGEQASPIFKFLKAPEIILYDKSSYRDFVCVEDVCEVHESMLDKGGGIYNVGTGSPISFERVAELVSKKTGARIKKVPLPENLKEHYQDYTCANLSKLNWEIGKEKWKSVEEYLDDFN